MLAAGGQLRAPVWVTTPKIAMALALLRDGNGATAFGEVSLRGTLGCAPLMTSGEIPSLNERLKQAEYDATRALGLIHGPRP